MSAPAVLVLVVEDEPDLRQVLAEYIEHLGYAVAAVGHGTEALEWLRAHPAPRLILVDLAMPVMNGIRFREVQLSDPLLAAIPTVAVTASRPTTEELAQLTFNSVLRKPLQGARLKELLKQHCGEPLRARDPGANGK